MIVCPKKMAIIYIALAAAGPILAAPIPSNRFGTTDIDRTATQPRSFERDASIDVFEARTYVDSEDFERLMTRSTTLACPVRWPRKLTLAYYLQWIKKKKHSRKIKDAKNYKGPVPFARGNSLESIPRKNVDDTRKVHFDDSENLVCLLDQTCHPAPKKAIVWRAP